jgi:hypothetical protein
MYSMIQVRVPGQKYSLLMHLIVSSRLVKLPRGLSVRLERFQVMAIVWEQRKMLPAGLR